MTGEDVALICTSVLALAAIITAVVTAIKTRYDASKGEREVSVEERKAVVAERAQANSDAETTIQLLREQADILRKHRDEREEEIKAERAEWRSREEKLEGRLVKVEARQQEAERDYRNLVLTVTTMAFCANATTCPNYNAGDRRRNDSPKIEEKEGGVRR